MPKVEVGEAMVGMDRLGGCSEGYRLMPIIWKSEAVDEVTSWV